MSNDNTKQVLDEVKSLAAGQAYLTEKVTGLTAQVGSLKDEVGGIAAGQASLTSEVRIMSSSLTSLTRVVDRIDQRLVDVEQHVVSMKHRTDLIPDISEAVAKQFIYLDGHKKRLKRLEKVRA